MYTLEGVSSAANFITAYEPRLPFSICNVFFVFKGKLFTFIETTSARSVGIRILSLPYIIA